MSLEEKYNFKKFIQRIYISKNINDVYNMWTKIDLIIKWYVKSAFYHTVDGQLRDIEAKVQINDEYEWEWTDGTKLHGKILVADGKENLKFTFGNGVLVSINLKEVNGITLVELMQEQNMNEWENNFQNYMACFPGWQFYLTNLKSICEGGLDLREKNPDLDFLVNI